MQQLTPETFSAPCEKPESPSNYYIADDGLKHCPKCHGALQTALRMPDGSSRVVDCICDCQVAQRDAEQAAAEKRKQDAKRSKMIEQAFVSDAQRRITWALDDGKHGARQLDWARNYASKFKVYGGLEFGLLFWGESSSGKTFASTCIANDLLDAGCSVVMRSMPQILAERNFNDQKLLDRLIGCDLLILDDLGAERSTAYAQEFVYAVIDGRYSAKKPVIISTNLTLAELNEPQDQMSSRIYARILEMCRPVEMNTGRSRISASNYKAMDEVLTRPEREGE